MDVPATDGIAIDLAAADGPPALDLAAGADVAAEASVDGAKDGISSPRPVPARLRFVLRAATQAAACC